MFTHISGVIWLISNPESYYSMVDLDSNNTDSLETASAMIVLGYVGCLPIRLIFLG